MAEPTPWSIAAAEKLAAADALALEAEAAANAAVTSDEGHDGHDEQSTQDTLLVDERDGHLAALTPPLPPPPPPPPPSPPPRAARNAPRANETRPRALQRPMSSAALTTSAADVALRSGGSAAVSLLALASDGWDGEAEELLRAGGGDEERSAFREMVRGQGGRERSAPVASEAAAAEELARVTQVARRRRWSSPANPGRAQRSRRGNGGGLNRNDSEFDEDSARDVRRRWRERGFPRPPLGSSSTAAAAVNSKDRRARKEKRTQAALARARLGLPSLPAPSSAPSASASNAPLSADDEEGAAALPPVPQPRHTPPPPPSPPSSPMHPHGGGALRPAPPPSPLTVGIAAARARSPTTSPAGSVASAPGGDDALLFQPSDQNSSANAPHRSAERVDAPSSSAAAPPASAPAIVATPTKRRGSGSGSGGSGGGGTSVDDGSVVTPLRAGGGRGRRGGGRRGAKSGRKNGRNARARTPGDERAAAAARKLRLREARAHRERCEAALAEFTAALAAPPLPKSERGASGGGSARTAQRKRAVRVLSQSVARLAEISALLQSLRTGGGDVAAAASPPMPSSPRMTEEEAEALL